MHTEHSLAEAQGHSGGNELVDVTHPAQLEPAWPLGRRSGGCRLRRSAALRPPEGAPKSAQRNIPGQNWGRHRADPDDLKRPQGDHRPRWRHASARAKPWPDETLIRALARAHRWKRMLEDGGIARRRRLPRPRASRAASSTGCCG